MKPTSGTRKPYSGTTRSLVLALDIGTTFSGVSYAILEPGEVPKIHGVTRFPGQEHVAGNSKIPSIMYYDRHGNMKAAGAEADGASVLAQAEDEGWIKTELFKLRLRPKTMTLKMNGMRLSTLPRHKSAVDVFGDFLSYLFQCTRSFIIDTHANGHALWRAVEHDVQLVLSHPNGWEGAQQTKMRRAAVYGGLIPDTDEGKARIRFVTEGEASLHACVLNGLAQDVLQNPSGHGFIVADAGGGTLDISSYAIRGTSPLVIEEIAPPDCVFAGSVFVSRRARAFFEEKLKNSKYGTPDSVDHITKRFDETTKRLFRDSKELQFVPFGSPLDKDPLVGIRGGQLKLTGAEVAALFEPSILAAVASIKAQIEASAGAVKSVWLVGGFAASPWLFSQLQEHLSPFGVTVSRPDTQTSKAVADGAIGFYCDHHVSARMSKFMYGVEYLREYDANDEEHMARKHRLFELPSGPKLLPDAFDCILARGLKVKESTVFSRKYCTEVTNLSTLSVFEVEIWCYRGGNTIPKWILRNADNFSTLCYVRADLSPLAGSAQSKQGKNGKTYWTIVFSIEIHFGLTEFKARIKWVDNGKTRYGPASIVYNEGGHRAAEEEEPDSLPDDDTGAYSHPHSDKYRSYTSSRAPSRDPVPSSSRGIAHSSHSSHVDLPRSSTQSRVPSVDGHTYERDRRSSSGHTSRPETDNWRERESRSSTVLDKGKERERAIYADTPRAPERMSDRDRLVSVSARSTDSKASGKSNATAKLSETLNSVWGASAASTVTSKMPTPQTSPHVEAAAFNLATPREVKVATPQTTSKVATPHAASKVPTPQAVSKAPTPPISKPPTPPAVSKAPTSVVASKAPTPPATSKVPTPQATPRSLSTWGEPLAAASKVATPSAVPKSLSTWGASKAATPLPGTSKYATPVSASKAASKVPTPLATSRVATPKALSKVGTPTTERKDPWGEASTPKVEFDLSHEQPAAEPSTSTVDLGPSHNDKLTALADAAAGHNFTEAVQPPAADIIAAPVQIDPIPAELSVETKKDVSMDDWGFVESGEKDQDKATSVFGWDNPDTDDKGQTTASLFGNTDDNKPSESSGNGGMDELWNADKTNESTGGFSGFLTSGSKWGSGSNNNNSNTNNKSTSAFGGTSWGSGIGSSLGPGLGGWGSGGSKPAGGSGWGTSVENILGFGSASKNEDDPVIPPLPSEDLTRPVPSPKVDELKLDTSPTALEAETEKAAKAKQAPEEPSTPATPAVETSGSKSKKKKNNTKGKKGGKDDEDEDDKPAQGAVKAKEEAKAKEAEEAAAEAKRKEDEAAEDAKWREEAEAEAKRKEDEAAAEVQKQEETTAEAKKREEDAAAEIKKREEEAQAAKKAEEEAAAKNRDENTAEGEKKEDEEDSKKEDEDGGAPDVKNKAEENIKAEDAISRNDSGASAGPGKKGGKKKGGGKKGKK